MNELRSRIDAARDRLSPAERVVAEHLRERPDDAVLYSSAELARRTGVSKATVSRLLRSLGWDDAQQAREDIRAQRVRGLPVGPLAAAGLDLEARNLAAARAAWESAGPWRIAGAIAGARRVLVVGLRNSYPVALHLRGQLAQIRPAVAVAPVIGQSLAEDLVGLEEHDLVVLIGFRRRPSGFDALVERLRSASVRTVLIADPSAADCGDGLDATVLCPVDAAGPFDSYGAAMALVSRIATDVHTVLGAPARARAIAIAEAYADLDEVEEKAGVASR